MSRDACGPVLTHTAQVGAFITKLCCIPYCFVRVFFSLFIFPLKVKNKSHDELANISVYS
jgi:hypothetical protein